jgi:homoserine O-succinyltransferase/O-acetyltransferase
MYIHQTFQQTRHSGSDTPLVVGLVNNTSDRALHATESQFLKLLHSNVHKTNVVPKFFTCPEIHRSVPPRTASGEPYNDIANLFDAPVDAIIVTGMEPQTARIEDEPVWGSLTELVDWAEDHAIPALWSCLAAHAAVLHLDGIHRTRQPGKLSDIFDCEIVPSAHLMTGLPPRWSVPHSRYYGISDAPLISKGYEILSYSAAAGVDVFMKTTSAPFVFFQGHPEYDPDTLLREYKRDVRRFFSGERNEYPIAPGRYFDMETEAGLTELRRRALTCRADQSLQGKVFDLIQNAVVPAAWETQAAQIYGNWLSSMKHSSLTPDLAVPSQLDVAIGSGWHDAVGTEAVLGK